MKNIRNKFSEISAVFNEILQNVNNFDPDLLFVIVSGDSLICSSNAHSIEHLLNVRVQQDLGKPGKNSLFKESLEISLREAQEIL